MASFNKFEQFIKDLGDKVHDLDADDIRVYLTNVAPSASADSVIADLAEISAGNGYDAGGKSATAVWTETSGTGKLTGTDIVWTASGGTIGAFRYAVLYNTTPTSPADPLIGWWDKGSSITLQNGETFTVDFGTSLFTIS
jgi:hypothetical protein